MYPSIRLLVLEYLELSPASSIGGALYLVPKKMGFFARQKQLDIFWSANEL